MEKKRRFFFLAFYSTSNNLLLVTRHILPTGLALKNALKVGTINFANSLSPPSIVNYRGKVTENWKRKKKEKEKKREKNVFTSVLG